MSRQEIVDIAVSGLGNGYKWGHGQWRRDGTGHVACSKEECTSCECVKWKKTKENEPKVCDNWYPAGGMGADCSGYVAKAWQVPAASDPEADSHPFGTDVFRTKTIHWTQIERGDLKRADALVYRKEADGTGHIVLFDSGATSNDDQNNNVTYTVYEAGGCLVGVRHGTKQISSAYIAIRRNNLTQSDCSDDTCNHHGDCQNDSGCACQVGYAGQACDRCELGFVGYPACKRADSKCQLSGALTCTTKMVHITPGGGANAMADYACGASGLTGGELVFRFDAPKTGKANIRIDSSDAAGARVLLLRGACAPDGCVAASESHVEFDYGAGEVYFIAVDTPGSSSGDVTLNVDCMPDKTPGVGDPCSGPSDCNFSANGQSGFCYQTAASGFCSLPCTKYCPDRPNEAADTFCIADPSHETEGVCVPKADSLNQHCGALPGTAAKTAPRFHESISAEVCYPGAAAPSCSGGFAGRVVDFATKQPISNARISVDGAVGMMLQTDADGMYRTDRMPCGSYQLRIDASGYMPVNAGLAVTANTMTQMTALKAVSAAACASSGTLKGLVFDAISRERRPIASSKVSIGAGIGQGIGPIAFEIESDADGMFTAQDVPSGTYTVTASADGYTAAHATVSVCGASQPQTQDLGLTATSSAPFRAVLRWSQPKDLDLHLQTPQGDEVYFFTPCRGSLDHAPFAYLDVDRRNAEGPEVVSVSSLLPGRYTLFVHNYSAQTQADPTQLPDSGAEVTVYGRDNQLLATFAVPTTGSGLFWDVFSFDGADPTKLTPIQRLTQRPDPELEYSEDCRP